MDNIALQPRSPNRSIGCHSPEGEVRSRGRSREWSFFAPGWRIAALSMAAVLMMSGSAPAEPPTDQQVTLTATDYAFSPKEIRVVTGRPMTLTFVNRGEHTHGLRLVLSYGELPIPINVPAGQSSTTTIDNLGNAGSYKFYCPVDEHQQRGMVGTIVVSAAK